MDLTKDEVVQKMKSEMPYWLEPKLVPYIKEAMQIYADQEVKAYASWLSNQVIAGRTATKLFMDYKAQFEVSA